MCLCGGRGIVGYCDYLERCDAKIDCSTSEEIERGIRSYLVGPGEACLRDDGQLMEVWKQGIIERDNKIAEMQSHIDCLKSELAEVQQNKQELPAEPIKVAEMLIYATKTCETNNMQRALGAAETIDYDIYSKSDLKQIAEHLLVYCNNEEEE